MPEFQHTPGPWFYGLHRYSDDSNEYEVVIKPFDYVGPGYYDNPSILDANGTEIVGCDEYHVFSTPANKQLMCAAPDLLDALVNLLAEFQQLSDSGDAGRLSIENQPFGKAAYQAIDKATQPLNPA